MSYATHDELDAAVNASRREVLELVKDVLSYSHDFEEFKGNLLQSINENLASEEDEDDSYNDRACGVRDGGIISSK